MRPRMASVRPMLTRASRHDPYGGALESVAAEFALLAQRRARAARQIDLLGLQLRAAQASLEAVQTRMSALAWRMDRIDPDLRPVAAPSPPVQRPPPLHAALPQANGAQASGAQASRPQANRARAAPAQASRPQPAPAQPVRAQAAPPFAEPPPATRFKPSRQMMVPRSKRQAPRRRPFPPE